MCGGISKWNIRFLARPEVKLPAGGRHALLPTVVERVMKIQEVILRAMKKFGTRVTGVTEEVSAV
jgi:hypothetical protein